MINSISSMDKRPTVCAIIAAAGESRRMGSVDKMRALLNGRPIVARVIDTFQESPEVDEIVVVTHPRNKDWCRELVKRWGWDKVIGVCTGGERRQDSVAAGLRLLGQCDWVIIHDGARPLVTDDLISQGLSAARETGAAVAAVPVKDTIKLAGEESVVRETLPRQHLWAAQTPQVFRFDIISEAYRHAEEDVTDDAALVEKLGGKVKLYLGSYDNMKVTTRDDLVLAEMLWRKHGK